MSGSGYAMRHPTRVARIVSVDIGGFRPGIESWWTNPLSS